MPVSLAFGIETTTTTIIEAVIDYFFIADLCLNFFTTFEVILEIDQG